MKSAQSPCVYMSMNGMRFEVNLTTYTDVGLFLDHRPLRRLLLESCREACPEFILLHRAECRRR